MALPTSAARGGCCICVGAVFMFDPAQKSALFLSYPGTPRQTHIDNHLENGGCATYFRFGRKRRKALMALCGDSTSERTARDSRRIATMIRAYCEVKKGVL